MNRNNRPMVSTVAARNDLLVEVSWSSGSRRGRTEIIDLSPVINSTKFFRPLRNNRQLFETVHPVLGGDAIAWGDDEEIDLGAGEIERLAVEKMSSDDLRAFLRQQKLSETALAAILEYGRRRIVSFVNDEAPIPRVVALACHYIELRHPKPVAPRTSIRTVAEANIAASDSIVRTASMNDINLVQSFESHAA